MKQKNKNTRFYHFLLADDLRDYLKIKAEENYTNVSQYIVNLIFADKKKNDLIKKTNK